MKKARTAAAAAGTDGAAATEAVRLAFKKLDQSAASHLIHKNAASRLKSRLTRLVKKSATAKTEPKTHSKGTAAK